MKKTVLKKESKFNKIHLKLFALIFVIAVIITLPTYLKSPYMDTYCNEVMGYFGTAENFIGSGRLFSALLFYLIGFIHLPFEALDFFASLFSTLFLSLSVFVTYLVMSNGIENKKNKVLILIASFVTFFVPFMIEIYMFDESMIMCLGIFFSVLGAKGINDDNLKGYLLAFLYVTLSVLCYQASVSFLIPMVIIFASKKTTGDLKKDLIGLVKKLFLSFVFYGIAFFVDLGLVLISKSIFGNATNKVGNVDLFRNLHHIRTYLLPLMFKTLYDYINVKLFYIITLVISIFGIIGIYKNENKVFNILTFIGVILFATLMPVVPNVVMSSDLNYLDARQALTFVSVPGMISLLILTKFSLSNNYLNYGFALVLCFIFIVYSYLFLVNFKQDNDRYNNDMKYLKDVQKNIENYEKENKVKVKNIYFAFDKNSSEFYKAKFNNLTSLRLTSRGGWAMNCALNAYGEVDYKINYFQMSDKDLEKYFKDKDYKKFNKKQLVFDEDQLYLLVY